MLFSIRIITGKYKNRRLVFDKNLAGRPITDRLKTILFDVLQSEIKGSICLDAFAGSGSIGIEAISRGARHVYLAEKHSATHNLLKQNLQIVTEGDTQDDAKQSRQADEALAIKPQQDIPELSGRQYTLLHDVLRFEFTHKFDIIFLDPPYTAYDAAKTIGLVCEFSKYLNNDGVCVVKAPKRMLLDLSTMAPDFRLQTERSAGNNKLLFLRYEPTQKEVADV